MLEIKKAVVVKVERSNKVLQEVTLEIEHPCKKAMNYIQMMGEIRAGDVVLVNTTACSLNLGTGGYHFIMGNSSSGDRELLDTGHGMKLKYTPNQINVLFAEEEASELHGFFFRDLDLGGKLLLVGELHSMLVPLCAHLKYCTEGEIRVGCIVSDHGALPIGMSRNIEILKDKGLLDKSVTIGNAFGGDYECVNIYTALQLLANILNMDVIIITMGPGIMGTGTPFGFSGLELGFYLEFCHGRGANAFYVPRISFRDARIRHRGISHHFITVLQKIVRGSIPIILPIMDINKLKYVMTQLRLSGLLVKHPVHIRSGKNIVNSLSRYKLDPTTMGRGLDEEREFFHGLGAIVEYVLTRL